MAELLSFWQSIREYQLPYSQEQELHQAIAQLSDYIKGLALGIDDLDASIPDSAKREIIAKNYAKYQELLQCGMDIMYKHIDISSLSNRALIALIQENGYGYITDLLTLENKHLRNMVYFLPLIQALKGTIPGLTILLSCFADEVEITEWWQDPKHEMKRYTFDIKVLRLNNMELVSDLPNRIYDFCAEYVYPTLAQLVIHVTYSDENAIKVHPFCELTRGLVAMPEFNECAIQIHTKIQEICQTQYVESYEKDSEMYTLVWIDNNSQYRFIFTNKTDFTNGLANDIMYLRIKDNESGSSVDQLFWGPESAYNAEDGWIYMGQLTDDPAVIPDLVEAAAEAVISYSPVA